RSKAATSNSSYVACSRPAACSMTHCATAAPARPGRVLPRTTAILGVLIGATIPRATWRPGGDLLGGVGLFVGRLELGAGLGTEAAQRDGAVRGAHQVGLARLEVDGEPTVAQLLAGRRHGDQVGVSPGEPALDLEGRTR